MPQLWLNNTKHENENRYAIAHSGCRKPRPCLSERRSTCCVYT